jgi:hypothetical protein
LRPLAEQRPPTWSQPPVALDFIDQNDPGGVRAQDFAARLQVTRRREDCLSRTGDQRRFSCSASARSSIGTATAPTLRTARATTIHTGELGAHKATRTPVPIPVSRNPQAKPNALSATVAVPQVSLPSTANAMTAGCRSRNARSRSKPPMFQEAVTANSSLDQSPIRERMPTSHPN